MATDKEECFDDAMANYNDATEQAGKKPIDIDFQKVWAQDPITGNWQEAPPVNHWWEVFEWVRKNVLGQIRRPDITMKGPDGKTLVVDKKFTRSDGSVDDWGTRPGKVNGNTQRPDYNDINKQHNPGNDDAQDLKLDPSEGSCNCQGEPQQQEVEIPVQSPAANPMVPGFNPVTGGAPAPVPGTTPVEPGPIEIPGGGGLIPIFE